MPSRDQRRNEQGSIRPNEQSVLVVYAWCSTTAALNNGLVCRYGSHIRSVGAPRCAKCLQ
eukprot:4365072-Pleurochrysis_carterae.AAC.2